MLTFEEKEHIYKWDGVTVPSVTQVIANWTKITVAGKEYYYSPYTGDVVTAAIIEQAGDWGTAAHKVAEYTLKYGGIDETSHAVLIDLSAQVKEWEATFKPEIILIEEPCYSAKYGYAGTPDIVCRIDGCEGVVDIKKYGAAKTVGIQTAAYGQMVFGKPVKRWLMEVSNPPNVRMTFREIRSDFMTDWAVFLSLMNVYNFKGN